MGKKLSSCLGVLKMKLEGIRPSSFSGPPLVMFTLSLLILLAGVDLFPTYHSYFWVAWILLFASWGISAEVSGKTLVLKYAFGFLKIRISSEEIEEILILNRLEKGVLLRYAPKIGAVYAGSLIYALYRYFTLPEGLLLGQYLWIVGLIVLSSSMILSMIIPFRKTSYKMFGAVIALLIGSVLLWFKTWTLEWIPWLIPISMVTLLAVHDSSDYIVLKTRKGKYLLTSNAPKDKVENALKTIMEALSDD